MAGDSFLKLSGIDGESKDDKHKGEIDVLSWSWGATQSGTMHQGGGGGSAKVTAHDMMVEKYVDKATPAIIKHVCDGKHIADGLLTVRKAGGDAQVDYLKIEMFEIVVSSYHTAGSQDSLERVQENLGLNMGKIKITFTEQTQQGTAGAASSQGWDFGTNKKA